MRTLPELQPPITSCCSGWIVNESICFCFPFTANSPESKLKRKIYDFWTVVEIPLVFLDSLLSDSPTAFIAPTSKIETYPSSPQEKRIYLFPIMMTLTLLTCLVWWFKSCNNCKWLKSQTRILQSLPAEMINLLHKDTVRSMMTSLYPCKTPCRLPFVTLHTFTSLNLNELTYHLTQL